MKNSNKIQTLLGHQSEHTRTLLWEKHEQIKRHKWITTERKWRKDITKLTSRGNANNYGKTKEKWEKEKWGKWMKNDGR